ELLLALPLLPQRRQLLRRLLLRRAPQLTHLLLCARAHLLSLLLGSALRELRLTRRLLAHFLPHLLRGHQRFGQRALAVAVVLHLLVLARDPLVQRHVLAHQLFQAIGHEVEKVIHKGGIVAAHRTTEIALLLSYLEWRQIDHCVRSPNRIVPSRSIVLPSSTAIS